jgi:hypothetical protein
LTARRSSSGSSASSGNLALRAGRAGGGDRGPARGVDPDSVGPARSGDRMGTAKLYAERTGADFVAARRAVNSP